MDWSQSTFDCGISGAATAITQIEPKGRQQWSFASSSTHSFFLSFCEEVNKRAVVSLPILQEQHEYKIPKFHRWYWVIELNLNKLKEVESEHATNKLAVKHSTSKKSESYQAEPGETSKTRRHQKLRRLRKTSFNRIFQHQSELTYPYCLKHWAQRQTSREIHVIAT